MLLEASLQIHLLFPPFRLVEALLWDLCPVRQGISVYDMHVVNNVALLIENCLSSPDRYYIQIISK